MTTLRWVAVSLLTVGLAATAGAGEIVLTNGSHIQGELTSETIMVSTGADVIEIAPDQVAVLTPTEIRLKDGRVVRGTLVGGHLRARTALGELAVKIDELKEFRGDAAVAVAPPAPARAPAPPTPVTAAGGDSTPPAPASAAAAEADHSAGPAQVVDGATKIGRGVKTAAIGVGQTVVEGADRVHDGAKSVGQAIWEAMRSVGRSFEMVFGGSS